MLLGAGSLFPKVRNSLSLARSSAAFSAWSVRGQTQTFLRPQTVPGQEERRNFVKIGNLLKKIKVGWLIGPPPPPGSAEDWDRAIKINYLIFASAFLFAGVSYSQGWAVRRSDLFEIMKRDADKLREEEEKVYQESLARAQLRLQEVPLKTTLN